MKKVKMPAVEVYWYDGGLLPDRPDLMADGEGFMKDGMGGCLFVGSKDTLICGTGGFNPRLLSGRMPEVTPYIRRISGAVGYVDGPHEQDWLRACKESPENRLESTANFGYSGPFNEMVLLGVLAIRLQGLNKTLKWDAENMRFTNISAIGCMLSGSHAELIIFRLVGGLGVGVASMLSPLYILESIKRAISLESEGSWSVLRQKGLRIAVLAGIGLAVLSQFTGINAIIYYGPRIMEEAGIKLSNALGGQVIIGFVNVAATVFAIMKIDQYGRKKLLQGGITGMFISLIVVGVLFMIGKTQGVLLLIFILTFITSFAIGYGPVVWVLLSELYPTKVRGRAMSVAILALWVGCAIIGQVVPWMLETLTPAGTFFIFAICCIPVPFILKKIPETKGMSLEEIEEIWRVDGTK